VGVYYVIIVILKKPLQADSERISGEKETSLNRKAFIVTRRFFTAPAGSGGFRMTTMNMP